MWWIWIWSVMAWGFSPEQLAAAVEEGQAWRPLRQVEGLPKLPDDVYTKLKPGKVEVGLEAVEGHAAKKSWGVGVVDAPLDRIWAAINDESMHPKHTDLVYAELVEGTACKNGRKVFQYLDIGVPLVQDRWWITIRTANTKLEEESGGRMRELNWRSSTDANLVTSEEGMAKVQEGIPVGFTKGSWFLQSLGPNHTLIEYYTWVDPGGNLSPKMMSWFAGRSIRNTFEAMVEASKDPQLGCL